MRLHEEDISHSHRYCIAFSKLILNLNRLFRPEGPSLILLIEREYFRNRF